MKTFISKTCIYASIVLLIHILTAQFADGWTDYYYVHFTSPKKNSLILGTSRAAQGLQPAVLNSKLELSDEDAIYNFSFTQQNSPYGEVYYKAIQEKLVEGSKNGIFILAVDPWAISTWSRYVTQGLDDESEYREEKSFLKKIPQEAVFRNYRYLIENYTKGWGFILLKKIFGWRTSYSFLHDNGWLEINIPQDKESVKWRTEKKMKEYREILNEHTFSTTRMGYLEKTITLLKNYGEIYLVRLPVHKDLLQMENQLRPNFNRELQYISRRLNVSYYDMTSEDSEYVFTDGNHLYKDSGKQVSMEIANYIKNHVD